MERTRDNLRKHDRVGISDRAHRSCAYSRAILSRALFVRCGRSRFFPGSDRLSESLVRPGGPGKSDRQLHGCNSGIPDHRIPPWPGGYLVTTGS